MNHDGMAIQDEPGEPDVIVTVNLKILKAPVFRELVELVRNSLYSTVVSEDRAVFP